MEIIMMLTSLWQTTLKKLDIIQQNLVGTLTIGRVMTSVLTKTRQLLISTPLCQQICLPLR